MQQKNVNVVNKKSMSCRKVAVRHLPIFVSAGTVNKRKDSGRCPNPAGRQNFGRDKFFCMNGNRGFTLIELLVVVLIIGILAAVAVPQYQKAVEKSKAAQALTLLKSMYQAAQARLLASGQWPASVSDIDIEIPAALNDWKVEFQASALTTTHRGFNHSIYMVRKSGPYTGAGFVIYQDRDTLYKNNIELERILCVEHAMPAWSLRFTKGQGNYCQKIMQGTLLDASDGNPIFQMAY